MKYYVMSTASPQQVLAVFTNELAAHRLGYCTRGSGGFAVQSGVDFDEALKSVKALRKGHYGVAQGLADLFAEAGRACTREELLLFLQCKRPTLDCQLSALRKKNINIVFSHKKKRYVRTEPTARAGVDE